MNSRSALQRTSICAGLIAPPLAWAVAVQLAQILPYADCKKHGNSTAIAAFGAMAVVLLAAVFLWKIRGSFTGPENARPWHFVGSIAWLVSLVLGLAVSLQLIAALMLGACER